MKQLLVLCLLFAGCQDRNSNAFKVNTFEYHHGCFCTYYISQYNIPTDRYLQIVDSCGKYQVGDTLTLNKR